MNNCKEGNVALVKNKVKIFIICLENPNKDPRPLRAIRCCSNMGLDVSVMGCCKNEENNGVKYYEILFITTSIIKKILRKFCIVLLDYILPKNTLKYFSRLWSFRYGINYNIVNFIKKQNFDVFIVENIQLLPIIIHVKNNAKIIFDAREYYSRQNEHELLFEWFEKKGRIILCRDYLPQCDAVVTVSDGLRREFLNEFGIDAEVYRSTPFYVDHPVHPTDPERIRMVYHGAANRNRRIENLIEIVSLLDDRFSMDLILTGNLRYQQELRRKASSVKRVAFLDPVPIEEIIPTIGRYDIGFFYCEPTTFNLQNCLPNKFFEFIQARLMIAIGPSPDMAELVKGYGCGVIAEEFSVHAMAKSLNSLSAADIDRAKIQSDKASRELCFEKEKDKFINIINRFIN